MSNEQAESNVLKDQWGEERPWDGSKYPDGSAAHEGKITRPSGQGGNTPKSRPDHQDMFPANPEPSEHALARGKENEEVLRGQRDVITREPVGKDAPKTTNKDDKATNKEDRSK